MIGTGEAIDVLNQQVLFQDIQLLRVNGEGTITITRRQGNVISELHINEQIWGMLSDTKFHKELSDAMNYTLLDTKCQIVSKERVAYQIGITAVPTQGIVYHSSLGLQWKPPSRN